VKISENAGQKPTLPELPPVDKITLGGQVLFFRISQKRFY
jgi:hypothetical protein